MLSEGLWRHKHEGDRGTQRGLSDAGMKVARGHGIERGRSLRVMTEIGLTLRQRGQRSARSEEAEVLAGGKTERAHAGSFIPGSDSPEPSDSERSRRQ